MIADPTVDGIEQNLSIMVVLKGIWQRRIDSRLCGGGEQWLRQRKKTDGIAGKIHRAYPPIKGSLSSDAVGGKLINCRIISIGKDCWHEITMLFGYVGGRKILWQFGEEFQLIRYRIKILAP